MFRSKLVSYYLPKGFVTLDQDYQSLKNVPMRVKQLINAVNMFDSDSLMSCSNKINSAANILKNIYLGVTILNELTSTYNDDKNDSF